MYRRRIEQQNAMIARLTVERDTLIGDVSNAQSRITGFEAQVAGLLAQRREAEGTILGLEAREADLLSNHEALNLPCLLSTFHAPDHHLHLDPLVPPIPQHDT